MSTPLTLLAGILWICLITQKASSAGPNKGENREVFDLLCRAVLASEATPLNPLPAQEAKEAAARATSIELVIKMHSEVSKIAEAATTAPSEASPAATDNFPPKCKGENETKCREAAAFLKSLPAADKVLLSEAAAAKAGTKDKLLYTLRKMTKIHTSPPGFGKPGTKLQEIQAELIQAVYGKPTKRDTCQITGQRRRPRKPLRQVRVGSWCVSNAVDSGNSGLPMQQRRRKRNQQHRLLQNSNSQSSFYSSKRRHSRMEHHGNRMQGAETSTNSSRKSKLTSARYSSRRTPIQTKRQRRQNRLYRASKQRQRSNRLQRPRHRGQRCMRSIHSRPQYN
uniref:Variant surface glycoprotein 1125.5298 n=1 Tax=Trypanosoma brucei TaxID=5691 RepID=A0A1J0RBU2_9TRYP|nr:variant surface glycoprotein 1125.5298 [Trypanosoma brucei]